MISRRKFVTGSLAALAVPAVTATLVTEERGHRVRLRPAAATTTASTLAVGLVNNTGSDTVYAYVTGQAIDNGNALMLLEADGQTPYYPSSPSSPNQPVPVNCAIPLSASGGAARQITIPHLAGAGSGSRSDRRSPSSSTRAQPWSSRR